ncbi:MAG: 2-acylglycerophosphoethanolamine acyltransferase [Maricaulis sp.]|jgi:acyl-[acyl-carrier-protein]-phospholipid O-acyltransferase/long-chain-fatty-acid--[acyl-carrier-protein] ligase|nr:2-acylglycerophosphoethanolamine acyltransferase [Maricaulis sp.]
MTDGTAPAIAPDAAMATAISDDDGATNLSRVSGAPFARSQYNRSVFSALLKARAKVGGSKVCIIDADGRELTYDQLVQGAFALGNALKTGTKKGEKVAILLPTGAGAAIAFFALQAYGRIPAMLNFTAGPRALKAACRAAQATTVITARKFIELGNLEPLAASLGEDLKLVYLEDVRDGLGWQDKAMALAGTVAPMIVAARPDPDDTAVVLFTSGTEGDPKGVALSHINLVSNVEQAAAHVDIFETDICFNPLPTFHCFGLTGGLLLPLIVGIPAVLHPTPLQAKTIAKRVGETRSTVLFATDTFLNQYARNADKDDLKSLRFAVCGAERVKDETRALVRKMFALDILEGYGATEASPVIAVNQPGRNRSGTVGTLLPGMEAKLEPVEGIENAGRMWVRGPNVMQGYIYTSEPGVIVKPDEGWHDTGDVCSIDEDGFIAIRGRMKRFAKIGGEMVSLAVVENCATSIWPDDLHAAVTLPDPRKGEQIILLTANASADRSEFVAFTRNHGVAELSIPKKIVAVDEIPVLGTGKIDYVAVEKMAKAAIS